MKTSKGIYYKVSGVGKSILFFHGMGLNGTIFTNICKKLKNKCIVVDLRNHGFWECCENNKNF